ncbi:hypothetical protein HNQ59_000811 [Chitinivorax tropicus]|uniref:Uncharacterized protein n=1 Tax=Chitinivorax tropicus TaxID=714531 RepID=A0A840MLF4_9PROT|nr:hypothetical protein [Chitinivorax tropicus]MBB5017542.1 hypothetical protein [Chitinivorax tropicus]
MAALQEGWLVVAPLNLLGHKCGYAINKHRSDDAGTHHQQDLAERLGIQNAENKKAAGKTSRLATRLSADSFSV